MERTGSGSDAESGSGRPPLQPGRCLGIYTLVRRLGQGGMAEVWEAEEEGGRRVALKVLTDLPDRSPEDLERFTLEGRLAASISHPNCVYVYGAGEWDGYPAIAMQLMPGGTLADRLRESGALPPRQAVDAMLDVIEGLEAAQRIGVLHRDIKPSNCFLAEDGRVRIGDFGISKSLAQRSDLTATGMFIGTPTYASPEQVRGLDLDFRSDMFSAGATLYHLLTGEAPFAGKTPGDLLAKIVSERPRPPRRAGVRLPGGLEKVVLRMLEKDPADRYGSFEALRRALLPYSSQGLLPGRPPERFLAWCVDWFLISFPLSGLWTMAAVALGIGTARQGPGAISWMALSFLYYFLPEWRWGRTPGKALFGLRVTDSRGERLSARAAARRAGIFVAFDLPGMLFPLLVQAAGVSAEGDLAGLAGVAIRLASTAALLSTMRRGNGWALIHDLASRSRVYRLSGAPWWHVFRPGKQGEASAIELPPGRIGERGPYRLSRVLWEDETSTVYLGADDTLHRGVVIHEAAAGTAGKPLRVPRTESDARLRWLQSGEWEGVSWNAFELPSGTSLLDLVAGRGRLGWDETLPILRGLAAGLEDAVRGGDLPERLSIRNLWVDGHGRLRILEIPVRTDGRWPEDCGSVDPAHPAVLVQQAARLCLEGRLVPVSGLGESPPEVPLPEGARLLMERLCGPRDRRPALAEVAAGLRDLGRASPRVQRSARLPALLIPAGAAGFAGLAVTLVTLAVTLGAGDAWWLRPGRFPTILRDLEAARAHGDVDRAEAIRIVLAEAYGRLLEEEKAGRVVAAAPPREIRARLEEIRAGFREPGPAATWSAGWRLTRENARAALRTPETLLRTLAWLVLLFGYILGRILGILAIFSLIGTLLLGCGPLLFFSGLRLQDGRGRRAGRVLALARALLAWLPALAFLAAAIAFDLEAPRLLPLTDVIPARGKAWPVTIEAAPAVLAGVPALLAVLAASLWESLRVPGRSPADRLAGTWLVPR